MTENAASSSLGRFGDVEWRNHCARMLVHAFLLQRPICHFLKTTIFRRLVFEWLGLVRLCAHPVLVGAGEQHLHHQKGDVGAKSSADNQFTSVVVQLFCIAANMCLCRSCSGVMGFAACVLLLLKPDK